MLDGDHIVHKPSLQICRETHINKGNRMTNDAFLQIQAWYPFNQAKIDKSNARQFTDSVYRHAYANEHVLFSRGFNVQNFVVYGHACAVYFIRASNLDQ